MECLYNRKECCQDTTQCQTCQRFENMKGNEVGMKFDRDKLRWDLLPLQPIEEIVKVLTYGANKYAPNNWRLVSDGVSRYYSALMRHLVAYMDGELIDKESSLPHLAHALCNLVFMYELADDEATG